MSSKSQLDHFSILKRFHFPTSCRYKTQSRTIIMSDSQLNNTFTITKVPVFLFYTYTSHTNNMQQGCSDWAIQCALPGNMGQCVMATTWSCVIPGTARRKDGSCSGCVLVCFLPVTYCCHTSNVSFSPGNTILSLGTACKGCTRLYGTVWLPSVFSSSFLVDEYFVKYNQLSLESTGQICWPQNNVFPQIW